MIVLGAFFTTWIALTAAWKLHDLAWSGTRKLLTANHDHLQDRLDGKPEPWCIRDGTCARPVDPNKDYDSA